MYNTPSNEVKYGFCSSTNIFSSDLNALKGSNSLIILTDLGKKISLIGALMIGSSCISTIVSERVTFVIKEESIHCVDKILQLLSIIIVVY